MGDRQSPGPSGDVVIGVLGPLDAGDGAPGARQQRLVLAGLVARYPGAIRADRLIDAVWPHDPPTDPRKALQVVVARLRRALGDRAGIAFDGNGYRLDAPADRIDWVRFERLCADERGLPIAASLQRRDLLDEALGLWRGEPFGELGDEPLVSELSTRLRLQYEEAVSRRHDVRLAMDDLDGLIPELTAWARSRPLDEGAWSRLARALHRYGRPVEALRVLHQHRRTVRETAGVEPTSGLAELEARLLADDPATTERTTPGNLRVPKRSFVGRASEVRTVGELLVPGRVTTLVGTAGVGKTTLALQVAAGLRSRYRDGVWLCELAEITSEQSIVDALASALGIRRQRNKTLLDSIVAAHAEAEALLVLDNCEHVRVSASDVVAVLMRECPTLQLLATSREALGLRDERVVPLSPLTVPPDATVDPANPAVELFVERAREAGSGEDLDRGELGAVAEICRRLDGLPLAIELAAARARTMSVTEMSIRLDERFRLLTHDHVDRPRRQQRLWDAVDWSYQLLDAGDQEIFCQLSVFPGGFTAEAVSVVSGLSLAEAENVVWSLVDRSLLTTAGGSGATRYRMLETLRQFGQELLRRSDAEEEAKDAHLAYFVQLAETARRHIRGADEADHVARVRDELANLRAAHQYALGRGRTELAARLVTALHEYGEWRQFPELGIWAEATLDQLPTIVDRTPALRAIAGWGRCIAGDFAAAVEHADLGIEAERKGGVECGWLHDVHAHCAYFQGDTAQGLAHGSVEIDRARAAGDAYRLSYVLADSGTHAAVADDTVLGGERAQEALALAEQIGNPSLVSMAQMAHGFVIRESEPVAAIEWFRRAAELADTVDSSWTSSICRSELAVLLALHGDPCEALELGRAQFMAFRRAGDAARVRGTIRMMIPALQRRLDPSRWCDLLTLDAGTGDRPHVREAFNDRAVAEAVAAIGAELESGSAERAVARGRALADADVFELGSQLVELALEPDPAG